MLSDLLQEIFDIVRENYPRKYQEIVTMLGEGTKITLNIDGEYGTLHVEDQVVRILAGKYSDRSVVTAEMTGDTVLAIIEGRTKLENAIESENVFASGETESLQSFARVIEIVASVAPASSEMIILLSRFRQWTLRNKGTKQKVRVRTVRKRSR